MTGAERIDYLICELAGDNARVFSEKVGIGTATTSRLRKGTYHIGKYADKICAAYPVINRMWLLHGIGESGVIQRKSAADYEAEIARLNKIVDTLTKEVRQNQAIIAKLIK